MKEKILLILIIILLFGCSRRDNTIKENIQSQNIKSNELIETEKQEENKSDWFVGAINKNLKIHLKLDILQNNVSGVYYYDNYKQNIELSGKILNKTFMVSEKGSKGNIEAMFISDELIEGVWYDEKNTYPLYLIREGSGVPVPAEADSSMMKWKDSWNGENAGFYSGSELTITPIFNNLIRFDIFAYSGTATGGFLSVALLVNDMAIYEGENNTYLKFIMKDDGDIKLDSNDYTYYCGMGVGYDTGYTKKKIEIPTPTAKETGLVYTDEQEKLFKELTGDYYMTFIRNAQFYIDEIESNTPGFSVRKFGLRGYFNSAIVMVNQTDNTILAAVEILDGICYFTNNKAFTNPPDIMKKWCDEKNGAKVITIVR